MKTVKKGSSRYLATLYVELINSYEHLYNEINNFTPKKKSKEYVKSFKASMSKVAMPLGREVQVLRNEIQGLIKKNKFIPTKI